MGIYLPILPLKTKESRSAGLWQRCVNGRKEATGLLLEFFMVGLTLDIDRKDVNGLASPLMKFV